MSKIGVGIIGTGAIAGSAYLPAYKRMPEVKLVAIADLNIKRCKILAKKFDVPNCYEDYQRLLQNKEVQAVTICTPPDTHAEIAIAAAEAHKHILCEKPMALRVEDADEMIQVADKNNVKLMVVHSLRYLENFRAAKRLLNKGMIGKPVLIRFEIITGGPFLTWPAVSKYYMKPGRGGEVLFNIGVHAVDLLRWIIDDEVRSVCSLVGTYGVAPEIIGKQIDDKALALLEFERGVFGEVCLSYMPTTFENILEICGTKGKILTELSFPSLISSKQTIRLYCGDRGPYIINVNQARSHMSLVIDDFIRCIVRDEKPKVSGYDGKKAIEIILAIYESYAEGVTKKL